MAGSQISDDSERKTTDTHSQEVAQIHFLKAAATSVVDNIQQGRNAQTDYQRNFSKTQLSDATSNFIKDHAGVLDYFTSKDRTGLQRWLQENVVFNQQVQTDILDLYDNKREAVAVGYTYFKDVVEPSGTAVAEGNNTTYTSSARNYQENRALYEKYGFTEQQYFKDSMEATYQARKSKDPKITRRESDLDYANFAFPLAQQAGFSIDSILQTARMLDQTYGTNIAEQWAGKAAQQQSFSRSYLAGLFSRVRNGDDERNEELKKYLKQFLPPTVMADVSKKIDGGDYEGADMAVILHTTPVKLKGDEGKLAVG